MGAGDRSALRSAGRGHGAQPVDEGGPLHLHADRHGLLGVPCDRGDFDRRAAALLGVRGQARADASRRRLLEPTRFPAARAVAFVATVVAVALLVIAISGAMTLVAGAVVIAAWR